jgi:hypothetical protein
MKRIPFIKLSLCLLLAFSGYAQKTKTYTESFNVNKDVKVSLNADNAEIIIETWNKNRVDVEATISVEIDDEDLAKEILENFKFEALGNSGKVEIRAGRRGPHVFSMMNDVQFFPGGQVEILTEDIKGIGTPPPPPPLPPLPPSVGNIDIDFDMERFNEEGKAYIIEFQKEIKDLYKDSDFKEEIQEWKIKFKEEMEKSGLKDSIRVLTYKLNNEMKPALRKMRKELKPAIIKMKKHLESNHPNHKVKKKIIIKMPKDATLDLDVKRSELKIASLHQIDANLNYSGLQIDELTGSNSSVAAMHSGVDILKANGLILNLQYARKVTIGEVNDLNSTSKTSNLTINTINERALIEGSFGDLVINKVNDNFQLIDINLKNSSAKLKLPEVKYNFYINSKSSDFNLDETLDYKLNTAFDSKIYQNKTAVNSSKVLNIKADYSSLELY